jgi:hypothetical protein
VGWFDNHCIFNPVFMVKRKAGDVVPTPTGVRLAILDDGVVLGYILPTTEPVDVGFSGLELQDEEGNPLWHVPSLDLDQ